MERIFGLAGQLSAELTECDHYKNYLSAKERVSTNPELLSKINEFKKNHMDYQMKLISGTQPALDEERRVAKLYWDLCLNEDARLLLTSEKAMLELLSAVQKIVLDGCKMDLDF